MLIEYDLVGVIYKVLLDVWFVLEYKCCYDKVCTAMNILEYNEPLYRYVGTIWKISSFNVLGQTTNIFVEGYPL